MLEIPTGDRAAFDDARLEMTLMIISGRSGEFVPFNGSGDEREDMAAALMARARWLGVEYNVHRSHGRIGGGCPNSRGYRYLTGTAPGVKFGRWVFWRRAKKIMRRNGRVLMRRLAVT